MPAPSPKIKNTNLLFKNYASIIGTSLAITSKFLSFKVWIPEHQAWWYSLYQYQLQIPPPLRRYYLVDHPHSIITLQHPSPHNVTHVSLDTMLPPLFAWLKEGGAWRQGYVGAHSATLSF